MLFEFCCLPKFTKMNIDKNVIYKGEIPEKELINRDYSKFFLSAHFANWEFQAYCFPLLFKDFLNIIVKTQSNIILDKKINKFREFSGNKMIAMGVSLREVYQKIIANEIVCFLIDQSAHSEYSVYVNFFGKKVSCFAGSSKLALKYRPKLIFAYVIRDNNYKYTILTEEIFYDDLKGTSEENIIILTQRIQSKLEDVVKRYPEQWLWFHRRFKYVKN